MAKRIGLVTIMLVALLTLLMSVSFGADHDIPIARRQIVEVSKQVQCE